MKAKFMRRPRTTQERRANGTRKVTNRCEYKVRAKRNAVNLVDAWDDIWENTERGWKKHRKTQYK
ncbi:MAG: hypothetical protein ACYSWP_25730 [Planctomycetota bacterium]|jgi:hypothetical protein